MRVSYEYSEPVRMPWVAPNSRKHFAFQRVSHQARILSQWKAPWNRPSQRQHPTQADIPVPSYRLFCAGQRTWKPSAMTSLLARRCEWIWFSSSHLSRPITQTCYIRGQYDADHRRTTGSERHTRISRTRIRVLVVRRSVPRDRLGRAHQGAEDGLLWTNLRRLGYRLRCGSSASATRTNLRRCCE